jgi:hypothetical protein
MREIANREVRGMKEKSSRDRADEVAAHFLKLIPRLPKTLNRLAKKIERFDPRAPTTFIADIKAEFAKCTTQLESSDQLVFHRLSTLLSDVLLKAEAQRTLKEVVKMTKSEAAKDPRYSLLLKLMNEADKRVPLVSIVVFMRHGDVEKSLGPQCAPLDLIEQAERERGESRATEVLRALSETYEPLYRQYLITIWGLSFFKEGKIPPVVVPSTGKLIQDTHERLSDYPGLVEPKAGWMRNSAVHNPRQYLLGQDAVMMWDKGGDPRAIPVSDLLAMVQSMYQISGVTIQRVGQLYMFRKLFGDMGLLDGLVEALPMLFSASEDEIQQLDERFTAKAEEMLRPMSEFFGSQSSPSAAGPQG